MDLRQSYIEKFYRIMVSGGSAKQRHEDAYRCLVEIARVSGHSRPYETELAADGMREVASEGTDYAATTLAMFGILNAGYNYAVTAANLLADMGTRAALAGLDEMSKRLHREIWHQDIDEIRDRAHRRYGQ